MALLDQLMNLSPEQSNALMTFGSGLLQAGGPSLRPIGFGQAFGGALQQAQAAMAEQEQRRLQREAAQQQAKLMGLKLRDAESDLANQEMMRTRQAQIAKGIAGLGGMGDQQVAAPVARRSNPFDFSTPVAQAPQPKMSKTEKYANRLLDEAAIYSQNGDFDGADKRYQAAFKLLPQVEGRSVERDPATGQLVNVITFKDGTQRVSEFGVKPDIQILNLGGRDEVVDKNAVRAGQTFTRTMTPGEVASNQLGLANFGLSRQRLALDQQQANKPIFSAEAGGFVLPPTQQNPRGGFVQPDALAARGPKLTEDQGKATGWLVQAENAFKNMMAVGRDSDGRPTSASRPGFNDVLAGIPSFGATEGLANILRGEDRQKFMQASSSLSESLLRAATGAGVNRDEAAQKVRELTPQIGDSESVIQQKFNAIPLYIESLKVRSGPGAPQAAKVLQGGQRGWSIQKVD